MHLLRVFIFSKTEHKRDLIPRDFCPFSGGEERALGTKVDITSVCGLLQGGVIWKPF